MLYSTDSFRQKIEHQQAVQMAVNAMIDVRIADEVAQRVREFAERSHSAYPQYKGHWEGWRPVRFTREVRTKSGTAFRPGDYSIVHEREVLPGAPDLKYTAFSIRNDVDTAVPAGSFVFLKD